MGGGSGRGSTHVPEGSEPPSCPDRLLSSHRYFGFITKHPADHRFACHVFVSEESTKALAESVGYVCVSCQAPSPVASPGLRPRAHSSCSAASLSPPRRSAQRPWATVAWREGWVVLRSKLLSCWALSSAEISLRKHCVQRTEPSSSGWGRRGPIRVPRGSCVKTLGRDLVPPQSFWCVCLPPRRAFQQFYKQFVEYTCPTEDIYLE